MRVGAVSLRQLHVTGRMDARYNLAVAEWLQERELDDTEENIRSAMKALEAEDAMRAQDAKTLRAEAAAKVEKAQLLEKSILTPTLRPRTER